MPISASALAPTGVGSELWLLYSPRGGPFASSVGARLKGEAESVVKAGAWSSGPGLPPGLDHCLALGETRPRPKPPSPHL